MKKIVAFLLVFAVLGCAHSGVSSMSAEEKDRAYSPVAETLSDFSKKIVGYYESQNRPVPADFDAQLFFAILKEIYPDPSKVESIQKDYRVSARSVDGSFSVMLCDPQADQKIMEDLSCRLDRVEIRSWQKSETVPCAFETDWTFYCK